MQSVLFQLRNCASFFQAIERRENLQSICVSASSQAGAYTCYSLDRPDSGRGRRGRAEGRGRGRRGRRERESAALQTVVTWQVSLMCPCSHTHPLTHTTHNAHTHTHTHTQTQPTHTRNVRVLGWKAGSPISSLLAVETPNWCSTLPWAWELGMVDIEHLETKWTCEILSSTSPYLQPLASFFL